MENESDTHNYTHLSLHTRSGRQSVSRSGCQLCKRRKRMNEKKKKREAREKKKQNFSNCRTSALGLSLPLCVARRSLPSHSLAHYACNNNGNRLGQTFFLNSRQVAASGALLPACLPATWDSGPRRLHVCNLDTQLCPVTCFICCCCCSLVLPLSPPPLSPADETEEL